MNGNLTGKYYHQSSGFSNSFCGLSNFKKTLLCSTVAVVKHRF